MNADEIRRIFSVESMTTAFEKTQAGAKEQGQDNGMAILASMVGQLHVLALGEIAAQLAELNHRMERYYPGTDKRA